MYPTGGAFHPCPSATAETRNVQYVRAALLLRVLGVSQEGEIWDRGWGGGGGGGGIVALERAGQLPSMSLFNVKNIGA